jgi:hypothetical protein
MVEGKLEINCRATFFLDETLSECIILQVRG